jgi:SAM-dependent methyltransferase
LLAPALWCFANATGPLENQKIKIVVPLLVASLFVSCMTCHGELARLKPSAEHLTTFYLCLSAGGALGGLFVALFARHFFSGVYEYPISYVLCAVLMLIVFWRQRPRWTQPRLDLSLWLAAVGATLLLAGYAARLTWHEALATKVMARNFYGVLRVQDFEDGNLHIRQLNHGTITHGLQILNPSMTHVPTSYYGRESGIGLTWQALSTTGPLKMGLVGLGAGTLAAYGRGGDNLRFYDINPAVVKIAKEDFMFLRDCPAHIDIVLGDARLSMASEPTQQFDVLVIDAFSGDAIPVHLLTREAFQIYWRHLKPDGVLAVHVSNHYLDLAPIVSLNAKEIGKRAEKVDNDDDDSQEVYASTYVLVSSRPGFFENPLLKKRFADVKPDRRIRPWTDDFSNLWQVLKIRG